MLIKQWLILHFMGENVEIYWNKVRVECMILRIVVLLDILSLSIKYVIIIHLAYFIIYLCIWTRLIGPFYIANN